MAQTDKIELTKEEEDLLQRVGSMFSTLDKLIRGMKLYEGKGPLVDRLLKDTMKKAEVVLTDKDITTKITPVGPMFLNHPLTNSSSPPKYLFQLYCDGVRELSFRPGLTESELLKLANVLNGEYVDGGEDMVTTLWKQELKHIRYYAVDTLGAQIDDQGSVELLSSQDKQLTSSDEGDEMKMSASDMRLLKSEDKLLWVRNCKAPSEATGAIAKTTKQIRSSLFSSYDYGRFVAITLKVSKDGGALPLLFNLLESLIAQKKVEPLSALFKAFVAIAKKGIDDVLPLIEAILKPSFLQNLAPLYEQNSAMFLPIFEQMPDIEGLSVEPLVELLKELPLGEVRKSLQEVLLQADVDMTSFHLGNLSNEDPNIVVNTIEALGEIGSEQALKALASALSNNLTEVRTAALKAMNGNFHPSAKLSLVKALKDPEKEIRVSSLKLLQDAKDKTIGSSVVGIMRGGDFANRDDDEQLMFFETLSKFPSPSTIDYLDQLLSEKNLIRNKKITSRQEFAVRCLSLMESPDAKPTLEKSVKRWFLPSNVKTAAKEAIQRKS